MKASTAAMLLLCFCSNHAAAQCVLAAAPAGGLRGTDLIKAAVAAQTRDPSIVRTSATREPAVARATPAVTPAPSAQGGERDLLLAGLALMAGIALRRYSAGPR